ncbi:MAG: cbb3-type cytochrome c oxidase subunit I [Rhodospirillales bacterium]
MRGITACAVAALAVGGLAAPLLALSRVPAVAEWPFWPVQAFEKGLVLHVVFSFVLWPLAVFGGIALSTGRPINAAAHRAALACFAAASVLLIFPAFTGAEASLNDYVPVIMHPVFYAGLGAAALGAALISSAAVRTGRRPETTETGAFVLLAALVCFVWALGALPDGTVPGAAAFQDLFWAGGHVLQFLNVLILIFGWRALAALALGREAVPPRIWAAALGLIAAGAAAGLGFFLMFEPFSAEYFRAYTLWQYALAPAPAIIGLCVLAAFWRARSAGEPCRDRLAQTAVLLSAVTFTLGGFFGLFVDGADARTPAHYHGVIGGLNLAAYGLIICVFLPAVGRALRPSRWVSAVFWLYALGQIIHAASLFIAGGYGAPRKTAGDTGGLEALGAQIGLYGIGVGGLLAAAGGVLFVVLAGRAVLRRTAQGQALVKKPGLL